ncbi:MAG: hypothetical protein D3910_20680, partial [Candidatus Electrothrix sp. ATG2]|nr:hypothetical protein [Candidatus Electrothrix sp. ATG2]
MAEPRLNIEQTKKEPLDAAPASAGEQKHDPEQNADKNEGQDTNKRETAVEHQEKRKMKKKKKKERKKSNPKTITVDGSEVCLKELIKEHQQLVDGAPKMNKFQRKAIRRYHRE